MDATRTGERASVRLRATDILDADTEQSVNRNIGETLARFAGGIAHDFNNLLTVITGYGELLFTELRGDSRLSDYLAQILQAAGKATEIVEMILAYRGRQLFSTEAIDIHQMLDRMRGFLGLYLGESIRLRYSLCREACTVRGDRGLFHWALLSIIMNAKEAMPEGGEIELSTQWIKGGEPGAPGMATSGTLVQLSVRDTGRGMDARDLERVFDPYFSTKRIANAAGVGLGLASAQGIVRQMGGRILAESTLNVGTGFHVQLPLACHR